MLLERVVPALGYMANQHGVFLKFLDRSSPMSIECTIVLVAIAYFYGLYRGEQEARREEPKE
jgi:hypothetical protein